MPELKFYVYAYLRKDNTPYYIGKGCNFRAWQSVKGHRPPKDKNKIVILEKYLSDVGSLALERRMIRWYGRKDIGTGILHNKTDGGDGANPGLKTRKKISEKGKLRIQSAETRLKQSKAATERWKSQELRDKQSITVSEFWIDKTRIKSKESIEKMVRTNTGRKRKPCNEETKQKISNSRLLTKPYEKKQCPYCLVFRDPGNLKRDHGDRCKQNPNKKPE